MTNRHMTEVAGGVRLGETPVRRGGRARGLVACAGLALALALLGIAGAAGAALAASSDNDELDEYSKRQVVYVRADAQGATDGVYVVNEFDASKDGRIVDQGRYNEVDNLTDSQKFANRRDEVEFDIVDLDDGASDLRDGATELAEGAAELKDGADELADGTGELRRETRDIEVKISDAVRAELEAYLNPEFQMVDFVNGSTANIDRVQFVIMTDTIEISDDDDTADTNDAAASEKTFWEKLMALFE